MKGSSAASALIAIVLFASIAHTSAVSYAGQTVVSLQGDEAIVSKFVESVSVIDVWGSKRLANNQVSIDIQIHHEEWKNRQPQAESFGITSTTLHHDLQQDIDTATEENQAAKRANPGDFFASYATYEEINRYLEGLQANFTGLVERFEIGKSLEGRSIFAVKITAPAKKGQTLKQDKPVIFYNAAQHAREWISPMTVLFIANALASNYTSGDPQAVELLETFQYVIVPVTNVDGYVWTHTADRLWRKNRRQNDGSTCVGVDNNRNWGYEYGHNDGSSGSACSSTYRGAHAFSEPEETALADYIATQANVAHYIDFHAYGYDFVWAWGYNKTVIPPENKDMKDAAQQFYDGVFGVFGSRYSLGNSGSAIYVTSGSAPDWTYGDQGVVFSYTCELRGPSFVINASNIRPSGIETYAGVRAIGKFVANYYRRAIATGGTLLS